MGRLTAIVLGSAAGGGFPQWNCLCPVCRLAWQGDRRVKLRGQASLAVSADGEHWTLLNAAPDLRAQIAAVPALHPRGASRASPISAIVLTGAEVDQAAGLLNLRERQPFTLYGTAETLGILGDNPMFNVLAPDVVSRQAVGLDQPFALPGGIEAELFAVPGKVPLYLEGENPDTSAETSANVGVTITAGDRRLVFVPGCAAVRPALHARLGRRRRAVRRHAVHRRRDDPHRHGNQKTDAVAWDACRSTGPAERCAALADLSAAAS